MNTFIFLTTFSLSVIGTEIEFVALNGNCPEGTLEAPNHNCFKFVNERKTFYDAESYCSSLGGHLAVVDSLFTNTFLAGRIKLKILFF